MIVRSLIGKELKKSRKEKKIKSEEIAASLGILKKSVTNYETGISINLNDLDKFFKICDVYEVNPFEIVERAETNFIRNCSDKFTKDEIERYVYEFGEINNKLRAQKIVINKRIKQTLEDVVNDLFLVNAIRNDEEKFNLITLLCSIVDTRVDQLKNK